MIEAWAPLSLGLAVAVQVGALAYWGGRISSRLEALEQRLGRLEQLETSRPRAALEGWSARAVGA